MPLMSLRQSVISKHRSLQVTCACLVLTVPLGQVYRGDSEDQLHPVTLQVEGNHKDKVLTMKSALHVSSEQAVGWRDGSVGKLLEAQA